MTGRELEARFGELRLKTQGLAALIEEAEKRGLDAAYQRVSLAIGRDFIEYGLEDLARGEIARSEVAADELGQVLGEASHEMERMLTDNLKPPPVPRFVTSKIQIRDGSFVAQRRWPDSKAENSTIIFTGYGHFDQVRRDLLKFRDYGVNLIQIEIGPSSTVVGPDQVRIDALEPVAEVFDRAARCDVSICLLISPHYFPDWALQRYPHLARCEGGFIKFCIDAPEAREIVSRHIRAVIQRLKDSPALHSICLTNEPIYRTCREDAYTKVLWAGHLESKFDGNLQRARAVLRTDAPDFGSFPIPDWRKVEPTPLYYEWCTFNQERFAGWHRWMADIVHAISPELPVHAKIMPTVLERRNVALGVDPLLFCTLSQINGNDCWCMYNHGEGIYAHDWLTQNIFCDLLRSFAPNPIFNSENHIIKDRERARIPWQHVRTALWQGAVHGQSATTIWVWERTFDEKGDFAGSIMHRPLCVKAVGDVSLDLMRFSEEVSALQRARPSVGIVYSMAAIVYDDNYLTDLKKAYEALNFTGSRISFVPPARISGFPVQEPIIVTGAAHLERSGIEGLAQFGANGGRVVLVGENCLRRDEYDQPIVAQRSARTVVLPSSLKVEELRSALLPFLRPVPVRPLDPSGELAWGVEWQCARLGARSILNAVNLLQDEIEVRWVGANGGALRLTDLFDGTIASESYLRPLEPMLADVEMPA